MYTWIHINDIEPSTGEMDKTKVVYGKTQPRTTETFIVGVNELRTDDKIIAGVSSSGIEIVCHEVRRSIPNSDYVPVYDTRRIRNHLYKPYKGRSEWHKAANEAMKYAAQANFQNR